MMKQVTGGVCAAKGFYASGIHCGIRKSKVKKDLAQKFEDWWVAPATQQKIADYKLKGKQLFFPNAGK